MKLYFKAVLLVLGILNFLQAGESEHNKTFLGIMFSGGARYDDVRMCVATDAGTKGGPMADIMLITRFKQSENRAIAVNLPLMRPILFGAAFKMLQFEPEINYEMIFGKIITGPGLGISFHYGPDYKSDPDHRGDSFWAAGPIISWKTGFLIGQEKNGQKIIALKTFFIPLFAADHANGYVLGGALEIRFGL